MASGPGGPASGPFRSVFEHSRIPMALIDGNRRWVALNDAGFKVFGYRSVDEITTLAGSTILDADSTVVDGLGSGFDTPTSCMESTSSPIAAEGRCT
ncbi:MAG TPA: PAS domain-containing protein [Solirubrobacteraceae bacterium]|nr:PAS domain-containing protein [Solirubrobacteraceae bacterium]